MLNNFVHIFFYLLFSFFLFDIFIAINNMYSACILLFVYFLMILLYNYNCYVFLLVLAEHSSKPVINLPSFESHYHSLSLLLYLYLTS
jgi:hypothetical protein